MKPGFNLIFLPKEPAMSLTQRLPWAADTVKTEPMVSTYIICICRHSFCCATYVDRDYDDDDDDDDDDDEEGVWFGND